MRNRLKQTSTDWRWWHALLAIAAFLLASAISLAGTSAASLSPAIGPLFQAWSVPLTFVAFASLALLFMRWSTGRWPSVEDLALKPRLTRRDLALLAVVFLVSHGLFVLLGAGQQHNPRQMFGEYGLAGSFPQVLPAIVATVVLAPVCEELLYRGIILRCLHDWARRRPRLSRVAVMLALLASSWLFALPHVADGLWTPVGLAYLISGLAFGVVYVASGSLTAAMVSHALQSVFAFGQLLVYGKGDHPVSPLLYVLVFGAPLWVFLCARALHALLPKASTVD
ncbi:MAG: type II CAAX endopeptidase family protein [Pseudoxanthomonas suwonensis]|nr:type II CAAX endopeptidase family protein [Pseudoxanthomonas suwonensis]